MKITSSSEGLSVFDAETITNLYLWGEKTLPADLYDRVKTDAYLQSLPTIVVDGRTVRVVELKIDGTDMMQDGAGRFARLSQFDVVEDFFETDGLAAGSYTYSQIITLMNDQRIFGKSYDDNITIKHSNRSDANDLTAERAYIFQNSSYLLGQRPQDSTPLRFVIDANGDKQIENAQIRPFDDNFDFTGGGFFSDIFNASVGGTIDPYEIGTRVEFSYQNGTIPTVTYRLADYEADRRYVSETTSLLPNTEGKAATEAKYEAAADYEIGGFSILVGTAGATTLDAEDAIGNGSFGDVSVLVLAGEGNDTVLGDSLGDRLYGHQGADVIEGRGGDDTLVGGSGNDSIEGGFGNDSLFGDASGENFRGAEERTIVAGNDTLEGGGGDDFLDGGAGTDIALFEGGGFDYDVSRNGDGTVTVAHARGSGTDGTDTLRNIEVARFGDGRELDLTVAELGGFTRISVPSTLVEGGGNVLSQTWSRTGDTGYAFDLFQDGSVIRSERLNDFRDSGYTWGAGSASAGLGVRVLDGSAFENDELLRVRYSLQESAGLQQSIIFAVSGTETTGPFSVDYLATGDDGTDDEGGAAFGDPHLITHDNVFYDFMAAGEFVLSRATEGPAFEVQARFVAISSAISVTDAMATTVDGVEVSVQRGPGGSSVLRLDGAVVSLANGGRIEVGDSGGSVTRSGRELTIENGNGDRVEVSSFGSFTGFLNVAVIPAGNRAPGALEGLLGNDNGIAGDDFQLADGTVLTTPLPTGVLYGAFADSWTIAVDDSLLPGEREDYAAPGRIITIDSLPPDLRARAEQAVDELGITNPILRDAAILDFALTGDLEFIEAAREADETFDPIVETQPIDLVLDPAVVLTANRADLFEGVAGQDTVALTVSRGDTEGDATFAWQVVPVSGDGSGADFVQGASGTVTIAAGVESATFDLALIDDAVAEGEGVVDVVITPQGPAMDTYEVLQRSVRLSLTDDDVALIDPTAALAAETISTKRGAPGGSTEGTLVGMTDDAFVFDTAAGRVVVDGDAARQAYAALDGGADLGDGKSRFSVLDASADTIIGTGVVRDLVGGVGRGDKDVAALLRAAAAGDERLDLLGLDEDSFAVRVFNDGRDTVDTLLFTDAQTAIDLSGVETPFA
jgi:Ca2+-binding RTX toxin-like protein